MDICANEKYKNGLIFIRSPCMNNKNEGAYMEMNVWSPGLVLTGEVPGDQHGGQDGALQLPPGVELLQAVHSLLSR